MSCQPETGGCERRRTDPFVAHLNEIEGCRFVHKECLDRLYRDCPQPEALYSDSRNDAQLVIERKAVVYPLDYVARHRNDHFIADHLIDELRELTEASPLSIDLEPAPRMSRDEMLTFACEISNVLHANIDSIRAGRAVGSARAGHRWRCFLDRYRMVDEPETGLIVRWTIPEELVSPDNLPLELADEIRRLFRATVAKFRNYPEARRILLLDPYGAIRYEDDWWWARAFKNVSVPQEIEEVWLGTFDWVTHFEQGWDFAKIHPLRSKGDTPRHILARIDDILDR